MTSDACWTSLHMAAEHLDLPALRDLLDAGGDVNEDGGGLMLIQHTIDGEIQGHVQQEPLHVDGAAYLLSRGADSLRRGDNGAGPTVEEIARLDGHWLATVLIEERKRAHPQAEPS